MGNAVTGGSSSSSAASSARSSHLARGSALPDWGDFFHVLFPNQTDVAVFGSAHTERKPLSQRPVKWFESGFRSVWALRNSAGGQLDFRNGAAGRKASRSSGKSGNGVVGRGGTTGAEDAAHQEPHVATSRSTKGNKAPARRNSDSGSSNPTPVKPRKMSHPCGLGVGPSPPPRGFAPLTRRGGQEIKSNPAPASTSSGAAAAPAPALPVNSDDEEDVDAITAPAQDPRANIGHACLKGKKADPNQDNFFAISFKEQKNFLLGVFDGHGPKGEAFSEIGALWTPLVVMREVENSVAAAGAGSSSCNASSILRSRSASSCSVGSSSTTGEVGATAASGRGCSSSSTAAARINAAVLLSAGVETDGTGYAGAGAGSSSLDVNALRTALVKTSLERRNEEGNETSAAAASVEKAGSDRSDLQPVEKAGTYGGGAVSTAEPSSSSSSAEEEPEQEGPEVVCSRQDLQEVPSTVEDVQDSILHGMRSAFTKLTKIATQKLVDASSADNSVLSMSGTTCVLVHGEVVGGAGEQAPQKVVVRCGWLGDSRALVIETLSFSDSTRLHKLTALTKDHKPEADEADRLRSGWASGENSIGFIRKQRVWFRCDDDLYPPSSASSSSSSSTASGGAGAPASSTTTASASSTTTSSSSLAASLSMGRSLGGLGSFFYGGGGRANSSNSAGSSGTGGTAFISGLNMSRSLGDRYAHEVGVSSEPETKILTVDLRWEVPGSSCGTSGSEPRAENEIENRDATRSTSTSSKETSAATTTSRTSSQQGTSIVEEKSVHVLLATDGVFEVMSNEEVAEAVVELLNEKKSTQQIAQAVAARAAEKWSGHYIDDITVVLYKV